MGTCEGACVGRVWDMCEERAVVCMLWLVTVSQRTALWSQFFASSIVLGSGNQAQAAKLTQPVLSL